MTPLQLAAKECANYRGGACLGVRFTEALSIVACTPAPTCSIAAERPCRYFAEFVLPMGAWTSDPRMEREISEAAHGYRQMQEAGGYFRPLNAPRTHQDALQRVGNRRQAAAKEGGVCWCERTATEGA